MPKAWIQAFADALPAIEAEQALTAATIAHLPHMTTASARGERSRILTQWQTTKATRRQRGRNGLHVSRTPREYRGWFNAAWNGKRYEP